MPDFDSQIAKANDTQISVVVPVYNSAEILPVLIERLGAVLTGMELSYEIILVDDNSLDESWEVLKHLRAGNERLRIFRLMRNFGEHNALICGLNQVRGQYIITLDDDLQNPPEEITKMYETLMKHDRDVIYGFSDTRRHSFFRNLTSDISRRFICRSILGINPKFSSYRIMTRAVVEQLIRQTDDLLYIDGLIAWTTTNTGHVSVRHDERYAGVSNYTVRALVSYFSTALFTYTMLPLRVIIWFGGATAAVGLSLAGYYFLRWLTGTTSVSGFTALILGITIFSGMQMLMIGILGEYLRHIFQKQSKKPQFIIREEL